MQLVLSFLTYTAVSLANNVTSQKLGGSYKCVGSVILTTVNDLTPDQSELSDLGAYRQIQSGNFYRERYFGLDSQGNKKPSDFVCDNLNHDGVYMNQQIYAECTDKTPSEYNLIEFLQGLYPPTSAVIDNTTLSGLYGGRLANGTAYKGPFNGYQYVPIDAPSQTSNDYFYLAGNNQCPAMSKAIQASKKSDAYQNIYNSTVQFHQSSDSSLFLFNESSSSTSLRWSISYNNSSSNLTIGGKSILGAIYKCLSGAKSKSSASLTILSTPFDNMFAIAGLLQLNKVSTNFTGKPNDGATYVWDLLQNSIGEQFVMFSFKNGTDFELTTYPMFDTEETVMKWSDFSNTMASISIASLEQWCKSCSSQAIQCRQFSSIYNYGNQLETHGANLASVAKGKMKFVSTKLSDLAVAGIGAGVTVAIILVFQLLGYLFYRFITKKRNSEAQRSYKTRV